MHISRKFLYIFWFIYIFIQTIVPLENVPRYKLKQLSGKYHDFLVLKSEVASDNILLCASL